MGTPSSGWRRYEGDQKLTGLPGKVQGLGV